MFKRVEKRRRKKEEEDELGLDEDMKEVLGMHDTDSEESDHSSSSDDPSNADDHDEPDEDFLDEDADESANEDVEPPITVQEALRDPVYIISLQPEMKGCIVCPGKLLKGQKMVEIHHMSNAHTRRFKQFKMLVGNAKPTANAWDIVRQDAANKPLTLSLTPTLNSKRTEKRKAKAAARKERRQESKQKAKAKTSVTTAVSQHDTLPSSPRKKQKVKGSSPVPAATAIHPPEAPKVASTETVIKNIVRSTSDRAKQARARASLKTRPKHSGAA